VSGRSIAAAALLAIATASPASAQRRLGPDPRAWLGCYRLAVGALSPAVDSAYAPPTTLRLDSLPAPTPPARRGRWLTVEAAMPPFAVRRPLLAVVGWRPSSGDSATVVWSDGFVRLTATFAQRGDSIAGTVVWRRVTPRLDPDGRPIPAEDSRASFSGARVTCG
jgi:hypothetical protein